MPLASQRTPCTLAQALAKEKGGKGAGRHFDESDVSQSQTSRGKVTTTTTTTPTPKGKKTTAASKKPDAKKKKTPSVTPPKKAPKKNEKTPRKGAASRKRCLSERSFSDTHHNATQNDSSDAGELVFLSSPDDNFVRKRRKTSPPTPPKKHTKKTLTYDTSSSCEPKKAVQMEIDATPLKLPRIRMPGVPLTPPFNSKETQTEKVSCPHCKHYVEKGEEQMHEASLCRERKGTPKVNRDVSQGGEVSLVCGSEVSSLSGSGMEVSVACGTEATRANLTDTEEPIPQGTTCALRSLIKDFVENHLAQSDAQRILDLTVRHNHLLPQIHRFLYQRYNEPSAMQAPHPIPSATNQKERLSAFLKEKALDGWDDAAVEEAMVREAGKEEAFFLKLEARYGEQVIPLDQFGDEAHAGVWKEMYALIEAYDPEQADLIPEKLAKAGVCARQLYRAVKEQCEPTPCTARILADRRARLERCIDKHSPNMLPHVDSLLEKYETGFELWFYNVLVALSGRVSIKSLV